MGADNAVDLEFTGGFDPVLSLISWGYHYPVSTYLDLVYNLLNREGLLIMDVRGGSGGAEEVKRRVGNLKVIHATQKVTRILAIKDLRGIDDSLE